VRRARRDHELLARAAAALEVGAAEVAERSTALAEQFREAEKQRRRLAADLAVVRVRDSHAAASPDARGVRWIVERGSGSMDELRPMAQAAMSLERCGFVGLVSEPPQVVFATSADSGLEAGALLKPVLAAIGGRGGGSARLAQGSVPASELEGMPARLLAAGNG
jgi:alanyl-tRNA synthetase